MSSAATNTTPATMTGAHALQGAAAATGDLAAAIPTGLDLLPATLADLADSLHAIRFELAEIKAGQHPPPPPAAVPPPPPPAAVPPPLPPAASAASNGRPAWWPPSPSLIPTWTDASPVYTHTAARTTVQQPAHRPGGPGGFTGPFAASTSFNPGRQEGSPEVPPLAQQPPRFTKLEFATYDGATDPLSPAEPDFADHFQAIACHAPGVSARQLADLFVGGLPDYIRVDVEMREPADLQTAMHYARAYEQRALAMQQVYAQRGSARPAPRPAPTPTAPPRPAPAAAPAGPPAPTRPFKRLTAAEQLERRRQGLCFKCDEKYAPGHTCARLFYLETVDDADVETLTAELAASTVTEAGVTTL
nr:uncharacterized protein LOC127310138 [Lolium perenne]